MPQSYPDTLALARRVLRALRVMNLIMGALILALLVASLVSEAAVFGALGARPAPHDSMLFVGMRFIMVLGFAAVPVVHFVLTRLLTIAVLLLFVLARIFEQGAHMREELEGTV